MGERKVAKLLTTQDMIEGHLDTQTLKEAVNEDKMITSRLGKEFASVPMASRLLVENGLLGATPFSTYDDMSASALVDGDYAIVTNDDVISKNGIYQKIGGEWIYINYNTASEVKDVRRQSLLQARYVLYDSFDDGIYGNYRYSLYDSYADSSINAEVITDDRVYLYYKHASKSISVTWQHTPSLMLKTIWQPNGHNLVFNFKSIYYATGSNPNTKAWVLIQEVLTDYVPPVSFVALSGATSTSGTATTGGNHGTSGGSGAITAYMTDCEFWANGRQLRSDYEGFVDSLTVKWTNMLYAGNTVNEQRFCLQQDMLADFSRGNVSITSQCTALEPIKIFYEGGTQIVGEGWDDAVSFYNGVTKGFVENTGQYLEAGTKSTAPNSWAVVLKSQKLGFVAAYIDREYGSKTDLIPADGVIAAKNTGSSYKFYNFTVRNHEMVTGESYSWRGGYSYSPKSIADGIESAFMTKIGGRSAVGYEALAGQEGVIKIPKRQLGNDYGQLTSTPRGLSVKATTYQSNLYREV